MNLVEPFRLPFARCAPTKASESLDTRVDRGTLLRNVAAGLLGTAVVTAATPDFQMIPGPETLAHAAEIGTEGSVVAVVGAGGECASQ